MTKDMEARLQVLLDRQDILNIVQTLGRAIDRCDKELAASCYWPDGLEDHGRYIGSPAGFIDWVERAMKSFQSTQHGMLNHVCDVQGDQAFGETYYQFISVAYQGPNMLTCGRYIDHFEKRNGEWRILSRTVLNEGMFDLITRPEPEGLPPSYGPDEVYPGTRDKTDMSYHRPPKPRRSR